MPLLATKLYLPPPRPNGVLRPRLTARLDAGLQRRLTVIAAPAGFGKTTLVSSWLAGQGRPVAWLSLDEADNDPTRFLSYLIAALQTVAPAVGAAQLAALQSPQPPPVESILTALLNDLAALPGGAILVLDDYHVIEAAAVEDALTFLLGHLPPQLHLVIASREKPRLPLGRLRAQSQLSELRAPDLRFTRAEAAEFLTRAMALPLAAADIAALEARTEGWIAGLQLAALSMQGHADAAGFVRSFSGSHQFVLDYLIEEVLSRQPAHIQRFLLRTSILERMCGPLCDAVLGAPGAPALAELERADLFIVPLDDERRWYRYHHLFADLLRQRLSQQAAEDGIGAAELHRRASQWHEDHGLALEAFQHAAAADDIARAERLIGGMPLHVPGTVAAIVGWLAGLPRAALDARPALWVKYAEIVVVSGQTTGVDAKLQAAEAALGRLGLADEPDAATRELIGHIATVRATLAITRYQADEVLIQARRALEHLAAGDLAFRATAHWALGLARQAQGDRAAARLALAESVALSQQSGNVFTLILALIGLGEIEELDTQLHLAAAAYRRVLELAGAHPQQIVYEAHLGLARICYQWDDLEAARRHGEQALWLARQYESVIDRFIVCELFLARLTLARGDVAGAAALVDQAGQLTRHHHFVFRLPDVAAARVAVLIRQGEAEAAERLAREHGLPLGLARALLALGDPAGALAALEPALAQAEARGWHDERMQALALQALARHAAGEREPAARLLGRALALAEPGGFIRAFVDEGAAMQRLLQDAVARGGAPEHARRLLAAFAAAPGPAQRPAPAAIVEPLSERELEVLRHIAEGRTDRDIAEQLYLSLHTVKVHARNIYGKLAVRNRTHAVTRARELGILARS